MTRVLVDLRRPDVAGLVVSSGRVEWRPTARRTEADVVVMPAPFSEPLTAGVAVVDVAPSGPSWCWKVTEYVTGGLTRYVAVPDVAEVGYTDLIDVDPATLDPAATPEAAWWAVAESMAVSGVEAVEAAGVATAAAGAAVGVAEALPAQAATAVAGEVVAQVDPKVAVATSAAGTAVHAKTAAEAARDRAEAVPTTSDALMTSVAADPETEFAAQLKATFVSGTVRPAGGSQTAGSVIEIGTEAAMPEDIGTAVIVGGGAPSYENVIGGITANVNTPTSNVPPGGAGTGAGALVAPDGNWNSILGGYDNVVNGWANQVQGYHCKVEAGANHGTIAGGSIHVIAANVGYATIGGGTFNTITGGYATVSGGASNTASGLNSTIGGGINHTATQRSAVVGGGEANDATATYATVGGGLSNDATGSAATVAGGQSNVASGASSFVAGRENAASSEWTVATGRNASASIPGERAHAGDMFAVKGDAQHRTFILRKQTADATPTELFANTAGTSRLAMPADSTWTFSALVTARRTDVDGESAGYKVEGVVDRNATANTISFVGTPTVTVLGEDNALWDCSVGVDTVNGALILRVTGEAGKTVRWVAVVNAVQVIG